MIDVNNLINTLKNVNPTANIVYFDDNALIAVTPSGHLIIRANAVQLLEVDLTADGIANLAMRYDVFSELWKNFITTNFNE